VPHRGEPPIIATSALHVLHYFGWIAEAPGGNLYRGRLPFGCLSPVTMTVLRQLRVVALLEGASYILLLMVAMPLKYLADLPVAVRIAGSVHGALFLAFLVALYRAAEVRDWPIRRSFLAFVSSIVPFGTFAFDRSLRREIAESPARSRDRA
jgi:integral membrane protein